MYLSRLRLNHRSRQVVVDTGNSYELHRTIMRAFPDVSEGGPGRVLYRLDLSRESGDVVLLVQSEKEPDWSCLQQREDYLLRGPEVRGDYPPLFRAGQLLLFRLRANPTRRDNETGKRQGVLTEEKQREWLLRKGQKGGFQPLSVTVIDEGFKRDNVDRTETDRQRLNHLSVRFDGVLRVTDPQAFHRAIIAGVGSAKAFGFGLLSVAPFRGS